MRWLNWLRQQLDPTPPAIPEAMWQSTLRALPFLDFLPESDKAKLKSLTEQLLAHTPFSGAAGLTLTDEMAVWIAAQAALPVLNLSLSLYDDMSAVIVVPDAVPIRRQMMDDDGVVHEWEEMLAGEAVDMGGAVLLSWPDIAGTQSEDAPLPHNVVIHEFAHKIDMGRGGANGYPPFLAGLHAREDFADWASVFSAAFDDFCDRVDRLDASLGTDFDPDQDEHATRYELLAGELPMDPYAATDPAEFFAVASEAFFVAPSRLAQAYPEVYRLLTRYYRQNPLPGPIQTRENP